MWLLTFLEFQGTLHALCLVICGKRGPRIRTVPIQNRQRRKEAARAALRASYKADPEKKRAASRASYKADPEKKRAASRASYKADPEKKRAARYRACPDKKRAARRAKYRLNLPPHASPMRAKAFLMLTGVHTKPVPGFNLGFLVWGRRSGLKLIVGGGGLRSQVGVF